MSKKILVDEIAGKFPSQADAERAVDAVTEGIIAATRRGEMISLRNFGTFANKPRAERTGKNPRTGETIKIASRNVLAFKSKVQF